MVINIFFYNFGEVIDGAIVLICNFEIIEQELMQIIFGLDFFIGVQIFGRLGIWEVYLIGWGFIIMWGVVFIEIMEYFGWFDWDVIIVIELFY